MVVGLDKDDVPKDVENATLWIMWRLLFGTKRGSTDLDAV